MTSSEIALVRLYYETYGMSVEEISSALSMSKVLVNSLVEEKALVPAVKPAEVDKKQLLMETDLERQLLMAPLYARTEVALLGKIYDTVMHIDPEEETAAAKIACVAKAWNSLKNASMTFRTEDTQGQQGIAIQILNTL